MAGDYNRQGITKLSLSVPTRPGPFTSWEPLCNYSTQTEQVGEMSSVTDFGDLRARINDVVDDPRCQIDCTPKREKTANGVWREQVTHHTAGTA